MSSSIALRRSPKPGALTATAWNVPRSLLTIRVATASPSTCGHDQEGLAHLHDLLEHGQHVLHGRDLAVGDEQVGVLEHRLQPVGVGYEVRGDVAAVELHALDRLQLGGEPLAVLDRDHAVLADLVHRLGDQLADLVALGGHRGDVGDVLVALDRHRDLLDVLDDRGHRLLDAGLELHRVGARGDVPEALADHALGEDGGGRGAVTGDVVRLRRHLAQQLGAGVLLGVLEVDLTHDRDAIVGHGRRAELLLEDDVATLGAERDPDRLCDHVDPALQALPRVYLERNSLCHVAPSNLLAKKKRDGRLGLPVRVEDRQHILLADDQVLDLLDLEFISCVLRVEHAVADVEVDGELAAVVQNAARPHRLDQPLLGLLLGGVRQHDTALRLLFPLYGLEDDTVTQRTKTHVS